MIRRNTLALAVAAAFAMGGAATLNAQSQHEGMGMMGMMKNCPMMTGMVEGPEAALRHAEALELTPDQVARLESLRDETRAPHRAAMERMRAIHEEIAAATADAFDETAVRAALARMGDLHEDMGVAMLRARHQTTGVLTAEQRATLAELHSHSMDMKDSMDGTQGMGGMMGMMQNCPMMRGGMGSGSEGHHPMRHRDGGAR